MLTRWSEATHAENQKPETFLGALYNILFLNNIMLESYIA